LASVKYLVLPVLIWIVLGLGSDVRFFRTVILDEIKQDYVTTARARGASDRSILFKHVLKNALIPIMTNLIIAIPSLFTGSLLLETFFGIPGLGNAFINALFHSDWPVINAFTYLGAVLFILFNLISDLVYSVVDPRIKLR
jgi:peptide/nickel transport system permease protein